MQFSRLLYETSNRKATITLNRPEKRNALDDAMVGELGTAFQHAARDQNVKVIIVRGAGPAFCAGADLEYLSRIAKYDLEENRADSNKLTHLFKTIYELRKPVIAAVHGPALAGGCGLASVCDIVIATEENASFGYTEVRIGFIPAVVMIFLIKRVGEGKARELVLRGNMISANEAATIGLVNIVVPAAVFEQTIEKLVSDLLQNNSLLAMGLCKEMLSKLHGLNLMEALDFAANMNAAARMTPDCKEGIAAFLNKEKLQW
ncbi:enoyl-CoA hydratase/isomerase family protein [Sphingobacteriales bacterium CHB3]|nr:enoyl-CoA hydratase/isomerase family protein [Sphingobacteriales bacterium CHB3]